MFSVLRRYWLLLGMMVLTVALLFILLYFSVRATFIKGVREYAIFVSSFVASQLNAEDIRQINGPEDMVKEAYLRVQRYLVSVKKLDKDIKYIYIMRHSSSPNAKPTDFEYVVDLPVIDFNENGVIDEDEKKMELPKTHYDASRYPALMNSYEKASADEDVSPDPPYPDLLSAYCPIKDAKGQTVAIVGVDITAATINLFLASSKIAIASCGIIVLLLLFSVASLYCNHRISATRIRDMNEELSQKNRKLEENLWLRNEFSRTIVHDMRNPLFVVWGYTELLAQSGVVKEEEALDMLKLIGTQVERMKGFLEDMLMLAKSESGNLILNKIPVDIGSLIKAEKENFAPLLQLAEVSMELDIPKESRLVEIDRELFSRILDNLISNALKFSPKNSTITIALEYPKEGMHTRLRVCDQGSGISNDSKEKLFKQFGTGSVRPVSGKQVGLGLIFCKMAVDAHHGRIYAEDNKPKGCAMIVEIP
ncbi:MAG: hypothetical protein A2X49_07965 [Lentisphaerae bacterium GWF2_52_8]|nr:MAG: hypothetical protein A2X49_07965 [Lentisphaerae bacterium GWF2_52_8]